MILMLGKFQEVFEIEVGVKLSQGNYGSVHVYRGQLSMMAMSPGSMRTSKK